MEVKPLEGVWKYLDWIPTSTSNEYVAGTTTYKAEALGKALGMSNLWVTFHGYWPEKGGMCPTGSFKDMEAVPTIQRLHDHGLQRPDLCQCRQHRARLHAFLWS